MEAWLNGLGAQGWELIGTHPTKTTAYIFKRPKETRRSIGHLG
jgi:hypothetical protein